MDAKLAVVRADALFEAVLGTALLAGAATGLLGADDFPSPVGSAVVASVGSLLVGLAAFLWRGAVSPAALAAANGFSAVVALVWLAVGDGFSTAGAFVVGVAGVGLAGLSAAQVGASAGRLGGLRRSGT
jgi:hypothetical protein